MRSRPSDEGGAGGKWGSVSFQLRGGQMFQLWPPDPRGLPVPLARSGRGFLLFGGVPPAGSKVLQRCRGEPVCGSSHMSADPFTPSRSLILVQMSTARPKGCRRTRTEPGFLLRL